MLQVDVKHFASDALEDAMRLAQTKSLNSYTFSDCLEYLNYTWSDIYSRMACIDDGYYGTNMKLTKELTKLPPFVKNTVQVYSAQSPVGYNRQVYRASGAADLTAVATYHISGTDLYCPDAVRRTVWVYFVPACPQIFFTHHNRDPKLHTEPRLTIRKTLYNVFSLHGFTEYGLEIDIANADAEQLGTVSKWIMKHRTTAEEEDITECIMNNSPSDEDGVWNVCYISCDYPYIFISYVHSITGEHVSGFLDAERQFNIYNPFDFTGRNSDVEYMECHWNDKTGLAVIVKDYNDLDESGLPRVKELGWTPDTRLDYPIPEMYRYLVARLADKLSAFNESNIMGVQKELIEAKYAFEAYLDRDKSAWKRINNVNPPTIGDLL